VPLGLHPLRDCDAGHGEQYDIGLLVTKLGVRSVVNRPQEENYQGISFPPLGWVSYNVTIHSLVAHFRQAKDQFANIIFCHYLSSFQMSLTLRLSPPYENIPNMILTFMAHNKVSLIGTVIGCRFDFLVS